MVVSMGRGVGDGKVVDGGAISGIVISDMVDSRRGDISDDGEVTCGIVVSSREGRGDGRSIDSGVVSGVVTLGITAFVGGNTGDGRVVFDTTCSKGEGKVKVMVGVKGEVCKP